MQVVPTNINKINASTTKANVLHQYNLANQGSFALLTFRSYPISQIYQQREVSNEIASVGCAPVDKSATACDEANLH